MLQKTATELRRIWYTIWQAIRPSIKLAIANKAVLDKRLPVLSQNLNEHFNH